MKYRSAAAFRQALEDQLRNRDQAHNVGIGRLRTQVAFERLLARRELRHSIEATFERYERHAIPDGLPHPPAAWGQAFTAMAGEVGLNTKELEQAYEELASFLEHAGVLREAS